MMGWWETPRIVGTVAATASLSSLFILAMRKLGLWETSDSYLPNDWLVQTFFIGLAVAILVMALKFIIEAIIRRRVKP